LRRGLRRSTKFGRRYTMRLPASRLGCVSLRSYRNGKPISGLVYKSVKSSHR
jgi:hypothetical protein